MRTERLAALALTLFLAVAALLPSARPAHAQQFIANQIENLISTDTMKVKIDGLSGALTGAIRIDKVTVSDPQGAFLTATDLAMDWSPLALVRSNVSIDKLTAAKIVLDRLPAGQPAATSGGGGFSLPAITADIKTIAIEEFVLGEAVAGKEARLKANASLTLKDDPTQLSAEASIDRLDQPGHVAFNVDFAPDDNRLVVKVDANEPQGGLVASLLGIPGAPPVALTVNGSGPLSGFMANGALSVDNTQAATLTARVDRQDAAYRAALSLNVAAERFVPEAYQRYVEGGAALDATVEIRDDGTYRIEQGTLSSKAVRLAASGTVDPSGSGNDLSVGLTAPGGGPLALSLGTPETPIEISVSSLKASLEGALAEAKLSIDASLPGVLYGEYGADDVGARLSSQGFDVTALTGPFELSASAASAKAPEGIARRFLDGQVKIAGSGALDANGIRLDPATLQTGSAELKVTGSAALSFSTFDLTLDSNFKTVALSAGLTPIAGERLAVSGNVARQADGALAAKDLKVSGDNLTISGSAGLGDGTVSADISGRLANAGAVSQSFSGAATFDLTASGPVAKPDVDLTVDGNGLSINGRELANLTVKATGTLDPASPRAKIDIAGVIDGQPLEGKAELTTQDGGERRLSGLVVRQGPNRITGDLVLNENFLPVGTLDVKLDDLAALAALGGVSASGDVSGTIGFDVLADGTPVAKPDLAGDSVSVAGTSLVGAKIDLSLYDYLGIPQPEGSVRALSVGAPGVDVESLSVDLSRADEGAENESTRLEATARANGIPVALAGNARFTPNETLVRLDRLTAEIPDAAVALTAPAEAKIANGTTTLSDFVLSVGDGTLTASGTAGETLDLSAGLSKVPAAVASPFLPDMSLAGTVDGTARVTGKASDPEARFDIRASQIVATRAGGVKTPPVDGTVAGSYAGGTLQLQTARLDLGEDGALTATGSVGDAIDLDVDLSQAPVALANAFVEGLDASGTLSGKAKLAGTTGAPQANFSLSGRQITAKAIAQAGIQPLALDASGSYADGTLTLANAVVEVGEASLTASGTIGDRLDVTARAENLPVGLVNGFVPDLSAEGIVSGTASATGTISDPNASFDIMGSGITTKEIARSGVKPLDLRLAGSYAAGTADIRTGVVNVGDGSLTVSGRVGENLDVTANVNRLPVGLVNGFVDGLGATGTVSGTAKATGALADPVASFDVTGRDITTAAIAKGGVPKLSLDAAGNYRNGTLGLDTAKIDVGDGSLRASGTVGRELDLDLALDALPVGLANGFVDGLNATGTVSGTGRATGSLSDPKATFNLSGSGITTEKIAKSGVAPLSLDAAGSYAGGTATIDRADVTVGDGSLNAKGTVGQTLDLTLKLSEIPVGLANGFVDGLGARGTISGSGKATGSLSDPQATFDLSGNGITTKAIADSGVPPLSLDASGSYAGGTATIDAAKLTVGSGSLTAKGTVGDQLDLDVTASDIPAGLANGFVAGLGARGTLSGSATATGSLANPSAEFTVSGTGITTNDIARSGTPPLTLDVAGSYRDGTLDLANAEVAVGKGSLTAKGTVGQELDIDVKLNQLPVGLANGFVEGLGAQGTVSGTATATGSLSNPNARFDLTAADVSVAQSRAAGAPPLAADLSGSYQGGNLDLRQALVRVGGGTIRVTGGASRTNLNLTAEIRSLPASIASAAAGGLAPQGTINGTVRATGAPTNPQVTYDLNASGVSIQQTRSAGVGALGISTKGQYAGNRVTTDTNLSGSGIALAVAGSVDLAGTPSFNLAANGTAPLSLANPILAEGGRSIQGTARLDARITGTAAQPNVNGTVSVAGARLVDANFNVALNDITTTIALTGTTATIQSFNAAISSGGRLTVGGTVGLTGQFPADLTIRADRARYNDGELIAARLSADLTLTGPLVATPTLSGTVNAEEIDVIVPDNLPSSLARIDVTHRNARPAVVEQQRELFPKSANGAGGGGGITLDITFNAPNRVFVRGRGLDIELGGSLRITGPASNLSIVGGFELQRGRFQILAKQLTFERGTLSFTGDLIPTLDLEASSTVDDVTVYVTVTGPANDPSVNFSSNPALPQDEVLARLIFGQGTSDLSPLQIAQLAEAAATLAGVGGSTGLLDNLRSQLGVDSLNISTTSDGQTAVGVGKYLNDNTYLGVDSTGRVSLELKLGGGLKAKGAVTSQGGGEVGVFYEGEF
ncbi:translocation/assembly module TamB domain-containing protein [Jiella sonneratiae]|uniref:Translocation/assembly module TamB domain-containing protein n=1 Tax=Jiella sonneratiae TaxID=2816856 RepID=A0ABS3J5Y5_9HYPH|nr:translocation/assembly module TamB domain-containing protein [Jiella sonneratiae]MBO0904373.1 translocation/assembly module TamB domain-containing protein [Jiella sonneratiae]